jgi:hypothetical protein
VLFYTCYWYLEFSVVMFYIWRTIITPKTIPMCIIVWLRFFLNTQPISTIFLESKAKPNLLFFTLSFVLSLVVQNLHPHYLGWHFNIIKQVCVVYSSAISWDIKTKFLVWTDSNMLYSPYNAFSVVSIWVCKHQNKE